MCFDTVVGNDIVTQHATPPKYPPSLVNSVVILSEGQFYFLLIQVRNVSSFLTHLKSMLHVMSLLMSGHWEALK